MDVLQYLEIKRSQCEANAEDQRHLAKPESANFWHGRALSFQEVSGALRSGIVTKEGIEKLDLSSITKPTT